ncbi:MAG: M1 family aminopeptidase [Thermoanaerobaculia bacterium]|nr:M1 family aminopeptidase [Thermoanaerobaculia bacterium]
MSPLRLAAVARRAAGAVVGDPLFWVLLVAIAFATVAINPAAMIPSGDAAVGGVAPFANSRHALAQVFALTGLVFYTFPVALLAGRALARDDEARLVDLLAATPLTTNERHLGKLLGVLAGLGLAMVVHGTLAVLWGEAGHFLGSTRGQGPFSTAAYLGPALVFLVPGVVFTATTAFVVSAWWRNSLVVYGFATALFILLLGTLGPASNGGVLEPFFALLDPWGARWLSRTVFGVDRGIAFYNQAALPFDGAFGLNRLLVLGAPALALVATLRHLNRRRRGALVPVRAAASLENSPSAPPAATFAPLGNLAMTAQPPRFWRTVATIAGAELRQLRSQPGPYLFGLFTVALLAEAAGSTRGFYDSPVIWTAGGLAIGNLELITGLGCLLLLFQLGEALDRPRRLRFHDLLGTTPIGNGAYLLGVGLAMMGLLALVLAAAATTGFGLLVLQGRGRAELAPFVTVWGLVAAPTFLAWGAFVTAVFGRLRSRSGTYAVGLVTLAATAGLLFAGRLTWVTNWPLWGALRWSDFGAFAVHGEPLLWNRLVVLALAAFFGLLAWAHWPRREHDRHPLPAARRLGLVISGLLLLAPALWLASRIHGGFEGGAQRAWQQEYHRRNAETWRDRPVPSLRHVDARLELEPAAGAVDGSFTLSNETAEPIEFLPFTVGYGFGPVNWTLDGAPIGFEDHSGLHVLALPAPLPPGGTCRVGFRFRSHVPAGFSRGGGEVAAFIRPSGVLLDTLEPTFLPALGFLDDRGVDPRDRPVPRPAPAEFWRAELPPVAGGAAFTSRLEITAPAELTVNSVGDRGAETTVGNRRTVVWESRHPVRFLSVVAGRWVEHRGGAAAVFHHPRHGDHADEILTALDAAHRHYSAWFGPYPWRELTLSEHPDHITRAKGFPSHLPFSEGLGFLSRDETVPGLPTLVTAHEAAHQWWAHLLTPGRGPGADLLIEGLAHYSTLLLLEAEHGPAAAADFARTIEARYTDTRRVDAERPLLAIPEITSATDETAVYDKGAWVFRMLEHEIGRERLLAGLRLLVERFGTRQGQTDHATVWDLLELLRPEAPDPERFQAFVDQWLERVVLPELQWRDIAVTPNGNTWTLTATLENVGTGTVAIDIAALGATTEQRVAQIVELAPRSPRALRFELPFAPIRLVVDPDLRLLQLHRARGEVRVGP